VGGAIGSSRAGTRGGEIVAGAGTRGGVIVAGMGTAGGGRLLRRSYSSIMPMKADR